MNAPAIAAGEEDKHPRCGMCGGTGWNDWREDDCPDCNGSGYADGHARDACSRCRCITRFDQLHVAADAAASIVCEPCMYAIDLEVST